MKTIQGNLIHFAQSSEFDLIVHGCNCFCTMGAGGMKRKKLRVERGWLMGRRKKEHPPSPRLRWTSRTPNIRLRQGFDGQVEHRMEENLELPKIGAGIAKGIKAAFRGWCRPFRAWNPVGDGTQSAALGWYVMPRWGGRGRRGEACLGRHERATIRDYRIVRFERNHP